MIQRQCWREQLIGMSEGKDKDKIRKLLKESIEKAKTKILSKVK